jgi:protocatechuate 3,4-dioxygenase beta subunit
VPDEDREGLRIAGRVLDRAGDPIPGIQIDVRAIDLRGLRDAEGERERMVQSQTDGRYALTRLDGREYRLSTRETSKHPSHSVVVRGGTEGVDLVLDRRLPLRIHGRVTGANGEPLPGARIEPVDQPAAGVASDDEGRYELHFESTSGAELLTLRFQAVGYRNHEERIALADFPAAGLRRDVGLDAARGFVLTGQVRATDGKVPAGLNVQLRSHRLHSRLHAPTDAEGRFRIENVEASDDWHLTIRPRTHFADVSLGPMRLEAGRGELEIVLEALAVGTVTGRMLGPDGRSLPGFQIEVSSSNAKGRSLRIVADADGSFLAEEVPSGTLQFETRALPSIRVSGIRLEPGVRERVDLVLDVGELDLAGRILGQRGRPVAGADVRLSWRHEVDGIRSTSFRRTVSDTEGTFRFVQLGPGPHELDVRAEGYVRARENLDVGRANRELELRLEPAP